MLITLENGLLRLTVDTLGAQMMSLQRGGQEYLWQGDPKYWSDRAPTLFPFIARLTNNSYRYKGKTYLLAMNGQTGKMVGNLPMSGRQMAKWFGICAGAAFTICMIGGLLL